MSNIWITSDWHFCHQKDFLWSPRGFKNPYEMNEAIIKRHNKLVQPEDDVYCLGDCVLNDNELGLYCIKQLKGNIHIIRGNHDSDTRIPLYSSCWNVVEICEGKFLNYNNYHFYLSHYPCICSNWDYDKPLKSRTISLCGHVHTENPFKDWDKGLIYHCEMDTNYCYPWNIDDIILNIKEKLKNEK